MSDLDRLLTGRPAPSRTVMITAVIVRSDAGGVLAAPVGGDRRHLLGPCRGATYLRPVTAPAGEGQHAHALERALLPAGSLVLLVLTAGAPWVASFDLPGSG